MWNILLHVHLFYIVLCKSNTFNNDFNHLDERQATATSVSVDSVCQRTYTNASYFCREHYKTGYDDLCSSLYCFDAVYLQTCVFSISPRDNTLCGNGKWCDAQSCVINPSVQATSDSCPLGDSRKPDIIFGLNCKEIVAKRPSLCRLSFVNQTWCCDGCEKRNRTDPAIFFGPARSAPKECREIFGSSSYFCQSEGINTPTICSTMKCFNPKTATCEPVTTENGVPCGNGKWCVEDQCISSVAAPVDPIADCMYGNQYEDFCQNKAVYPNVAKFCSQFENGCCETCSKHKNTSAPGCEYGDKTPDICHNHVVDGTIKSYCGIHESDCCETCPKFKSAGNSSCPFGDINKSVCEALMNDTIGPGNCYSMSHYQQCCETCPKYFIASHSGCEYGDHWKNYCAEHVVPPNVASVCSRYTTQCCGTCGKFEETEHPGCKYGDYDPVACTILIKSENGTASCYDPVQRTKCCASCDQLKDTSMPGCLYGDSKPEHCQQLLNNSRGIGNCYDLTTQTDCCRSCAHLRNNTSKGCEYGDKNPSFCSTNIANKASAFVCYQQEQNCCESCSFYKVSNQTDCKYGDKNPQQCLLQIPDASSAASLCPALGLHCCETCSMFGHPGPGGTTSPLILG